MESRFHHFPPQPYPALPFSADSTSSTPPLPPHHSPYSPQADPYAYETLSNNAHHQHHHPIAYPQQQRPPRDSSYSVQPQYPAGYAPSREMRDSRTSQYHYQAQHQQQPQQRQASPSPIYDQQRRGDPQAGPNKLRRPPAPLRHESLPSTTAPVMHRPQSTQRPPLPSSVHSFSSSISSPAAASFPVPMHSPYSQQSLESTVSLGLSPAVIPLYSPPESPQPAAPVAGEGDYAFGTVVSPALLLSVENSHLRNKNHKEIAFVDAQTRRPIYISREFRRGKTGQLLHDNEVRGADGIIWPEFHDGLEEQDGEGTGERGAVEYLLLECPSSGATRRAHLAGERAEPQKLGLVTEAVLYLRGGKKVVWSRFYKKSWFANSSREGTWKGIDGKKFRWDRMERKGAFEGEAVIRLIDEKTKEIMVVVHEVDSKPTKLILSALVLPSIQPVLLTLLHRAYADEAKKYRNDLRDFEDEEGRAW